MPGWSSWSLFIGSTNYTNYARFKSIKVRESLQANGRAMSVEIVKLPSGVTRPKAGQPIFFTVDGIKEFAGRIARVGEVQPLTTAGFVWPLECVDFTVDLDRHLVTLIMDEAYANEQIGKILAASGSGIGYGNIATGPWMPAVELVLETASGAISRIAESVQHQWYVDYDRNMNFFFVTDLPGPLAQINLDTDTATYYDVTVNEDWSQVKNRVSITGAQIKSTYDDFMQWTVTGDDRFFPLGYEPWSLEDTEVTVDGKVVGPTGLDGVNSEVGDSVDGVFLCLDNHGVRFGDNMAPGKPERPSVVAVKYKYAIDAIITVDDSRSIAEMAAREGATDAPSDGVHEYRFEVNQMRVVTEDALLDYANLLLRRYSMPNISVNFTSRVAGWAAGQNFNCLSNIRGLNFTAFVQSIDKQVRQLNGAYYFEYVVEATSSPFPG